MTGFVLVSLTLVGRIAPGQLFAARRFLEAVRGLVLPLPGRSIQVILLALFVALQKPLALLVVSLLFLCLLGTDRRRRHIIMIRLKRCNTLHNRRGKYGVCSLPFNHDPTPARPFLQILSPYSVSLNAVIKSCDSYICVKVGTYRESIRHKKCLGLVMIGSSCCQSLLSSGLVSKPCRPKPSCTTLIVFRPKWKTYRPHAR